MDCDRYAEANEIKTPTLQLMDICDDAIEIILKHLNLEELVNCADTNKRLNQIAQSVYSQKYRDCVLWFGNEDKGHDITEKHIRIDITAICFKLIRNFGKFIKTIEVGYVADLNVEDELNKNAARYKNMNEYVSEYCADSLEEITLFDFPFFKMNKPMKKLQKFCVHDHLINRKNRSAYLESISCMENLRCFMLESYKIGIPKALENYIPTLEEIYLKLYYYSDMDTFIQCLKMNQQIKKLHLNHQVGLRDNEILLSIANGSQIKELKLSLRRSDPFQNVQNCRFRTIEIFTFELITLNAVKDLTFDVLKELYYGSDFRCKKLYFDLTSISSCFMDFALRHKKLKKIQFKNNFITNVDLCKLQDELPELEEIVFNCVEEPMLKVLQKHFNRGWITIEIKNKSKASFKLQRLQNNSQSN